MRTIIIASLLLAQITSCSKNESEPTVPEPMPNPTQLYQMISLDTTKTAPNDTLGKTTFTYDGSNRIVKLSQFTYVPASNTYTLYYSFEYGYQGLDTLASTAYENLFTSYSTTRWKHFFKYDNNRLLTLDSSQNASEYMGNYDSTIFTISYLNASNGFTQTFQQ